MEIDVNGTRLWFDIDGAALVPNGSGMRDRPTVVLVHGGPGSYDHSYFKPDFGHMTRSAQVVYLDLRGHGRSAATAVDEWTFEACADDVRALCDTLGIARPIVFGHSMGGFVAMLYGARHPAHAGGLILQSTMARFDLERLADGFRRFGGDEIGELARRDYGGETVTDPEWDRVFATFGPRVPDPDQLARRIKDVELGRHGMDLMRQFDVVGQLRRIDCPTLVCVGALDPVTPVEASREIVEALPAGLGRLEILEGLGHFPWLDDPDRYWPVIEAFIVGGTSLT
jgi:proline iminopeptidase